jgi:hypothetical protein
MVILAPAVLLVAAEFGPAVLNGKEPSVCPQRLAQERADYLLIVSIGHESSIVGSRDYDPFRELSLPQRSEKMAVDHA